jgi:hypothetical protein
MFLINRGSGFDRWAGTQQSTVTRLTVDCCQGYFEVWTWNLQLPGKSVVFNATGFSGVRICMAMFSGWTRCVLAFSSLVAGTSLISSPSLIAVSALFSFTARFTLSAGITRLTRVSGLARGTLLSGLAGVSRRPRWPGRWRRAGIAPADEQR